MTDIVKLTAADARAHLDGLTELLRDIVASGASVGFLGAMTADENRAYWTDTIAEVEAGKRLLLIACDTGGTVAGCVQLALNFKPNGLHRGELVKLLVHTCHRGEGLSRRLMAAVEDEAVKAGVTLLVLDTEVNSLADTIYPKLGYMRIGEIPDYAASTDGMLHGTAIYYKRLAV
jgi:ribosomal protein S18 acetylase RimI-like enzyme